MDGLKNKSLTKNTTKTKTTTKSKTKKLKKLKKAEVNTGSKKVASTKKQ